MSAKSKGFVAGIAVGIALHYAYVQSMQNRTTGQ